jgi:succinate dehydrogenase hydrophobic anchor subunit
MDKHIRRISYGLVLIVLVTITIMALGYKAESNSDSDPVLRVFQTIIEFIMSYILGAGVENLINDYINFKNKKR